MINWQRAGAFPDIGGLGRVLFARRGERVEQRDDGRVRTGIRALT